MLLSREELTNFVDWLLKQKEEYESNGIDSIQRIYEECLGISNFKISEPLVSESQPDVKFVQAVKDDTISMKSDEDLISDSGLDNRGEFYLEPNEWENVCRSDVRCECVTLDKNRTNVFAEKFSE